MQEAEMLDRTSNEASIVDKTNNIVKSDSGVIEKPLIANDKKLEGWLQLTEVTGVEARKTGGKQFWFVYEDDTGKLYYYLQPQDQCHAGEIDIRHSTLTCDVGNRGRPGWFEIRSGIKIYNLDAQDRTHMFTWLETLQRKRRAHSLKLSESTHSCFDAKQEHFTASGLLGQKCTDTDSILLPKMDNLHIEIKDGLSSVYFSTAGNTQMVFLSTGNEDNFTVNEYLQSPTSLFSKSNHGPKQPISSDELLIDSKESEIPVSSNDSEIPAASNDNVIPADSKDNVIPADSKDIVIPADSKDNVIPADSKDIVIPADSKDNVIPADSKDIVIPVDSKDIVIPADSKDIVIPADSEDNVIPADSKDIVIPADSEDSEIPAVSFKQDAKLDRAFKSIDNLMSFKSPTNRSDCSQAFAEKSKRLPSGHNHTPATNPGSPVSTNSTDRKLNFMSVFSSSFKVKKEAMKKKVMNMSFRDLSQSTMIPENSGDSLQLSHTYTVVDDDFLYVNGNFTSTKEATNARNQSVDLLQNDTDVVEPVVNNRKQCNRKEEEEIMPVMEEKDKYILDMEQSVTTLLEEKNVLSGEVTHKDKTLKDLKDEISMFQQTLAVKDELIMSLTNKIQKLSNDCSLDISNQDKSTGYCIPFQNCPTFLTVEKKEFERLNDMCKAYEDQNTFITNEILELNALRQDDEVRESLLMIKIARLEAQYYQTRSKYLYLLNEIQMPKRGGDENQNHEAVNQLLQEAQDYEFESQDDEGNEVNCRSVYEKQYDCYGFVKFYHEEDRMLVTRANVLQKQSQEIEYKIRDADEETSKRIKWENFMIGLSPHKHLIRSSEIKFLLRLGIPNQFREKIWKSCINLYIQPVKVNVGVRYYKDLEVKVNNNKSNPAVKQIELDLLRTLPDNKYFEKSDSPGIKKLRRVLLCYSIHNPLIGYCQGLNRIAAIALLFLSEEDAFWCLVAITEHLMPGDYYTATLAAAQADQRVLKDLVQERCPKLCAHLEEHDVDLSLFTFNWFLTVFVDGVCPDLFLRVWDVFLYEGNKVLFRFALAFLKYAETEILKQKSNLAINKYMRRLGEKMTDVKRICTIAFSELNPFPMRPILNKRQYHLQQVKAELEELEKIRRQLRSAQKEKNHIEDKQDALLEDDFDDSFNNSQR